jgi:hypothetical protein
MLCASQEGNGRNCHASFLRYLGRRFYLEVLRRDLIDAGAPSKIDANPVVALTTDDSSVVYTVIDDVPEGTQVQY